jgi:predicted RNase H-like nuclease (RuvC/YqgF family)
MNEEPDIFESHNEDEENEIKIDITVADNEISIPPPKRNETIEQVIRNYLTTHNLSETLRSFTAEASEETHNENEEYSNALVISQLEGENQELKLELEKVKLENGFWNLFFSIIIFSYFSSKIRSQFDTVHKGYLFHKNEHKRILQEKNKLITSISRDLERFQKY